MQWIFVAADGQQFAFNEGDITSLIQSGQISAQTLLWREGMPQWTPASSLFPSAFGPSPSATQPMGGAVAAPGPRSPAPAPRQPGQATAALRQPATTPGTTQAMPAGMPEPGAIRRLSAPFQARKGWMKFLAVMMIVIGIVGIPFGIFFILAGVALLKAVSELDHANRTGDAHALEEANKRLSSVLFLQSVFIFIAVCLIAILLFLMGGALIAELNAVKEKLHAPAGSSQSSEESTLEMPTKLR